MKHNFYNHTNTKLAPIFYKIAEKNNTTAEVVYTEISNTIELAYQDATPDIIAELNSISLHGGKPSPEEFIFYLSTKIKV